MVGQFEDYVPDEWGPSLFIIFLIYGFFSSIIQLFLFIDYSLKFMCGLLVMCKYLELS